MTCREAAVEDSPIQLVFSPLLRGKESDINTTLSITKAKWQAETVSSQVYATMKIRKKET